MDNFALNLKNYNSCISFCSQNLGQKPYSIKNKDAFWLNSTPTLNTNAYQTTHTTVTPSPKKINNIEIEADTATAATGTAVILRGAQYCIEKLSELCARILMRGKEFATSEEVRRVADAMKSQNGLSAEIHYIDNSNKGVLKRLFPGLAKDIDTVANGGNAFYTHQGNFAVAPKSKPSLILHELGHATNFEKSKIFGGLQKLRVLGMYAPMALAFLNDITGKRKDGKESFVERNAGIIGFSAFLPTIIEEGAASWRGIKAAKNTLPNVKLGALKRNYFFAWMTYVLAGIGVGLASKLAICERKIKPQNNKDN